MLLVALFSPTWSHLANRLPNRRFPEIYLVPLALTYPCFLVGSEEVGRTPSFACRDGRCLTPKNLNIFRNPSHRLRKHIC